MSAAKRERDEDDIVTSNFTTADYQSALANQSVHISHLQKKLAAQCKTITDLMDSAKVCEEMVKSLREENERLKEEIQKITKAEMDETMGIPLTMKDESTLDAGPLSRTLSSR